MLFTFKRDLKLRDAPNLTAANPHGRVFPGDIATVRGVNGDWSEVSVTTTDGATKTGWIKSQWLKPFSPQDDVDPNIDLEIFAQSCVDAARIVGTSAIYLIAIADLESKIKNIPTAVEGGTAFGPFQIIVKTWEAYRFRPDFEIELAPQDRFDPYQQPLVAALIAAEGTKELISLSTIDQMPNANQLYLVHFLGLPAAKNALSGESTRSVLDVLTEVYSSKHNPAQFAQRIIDANKSLLSSGGTPNTIEQVLSAVDDRLTPAFKRAYEVLQVLPAEESTLGLPPSPNAGLIPWMAVAEGELGQTEIKGPSGSNQRIEEYFTTTTYHQWYPNVTDDTPWCGAFVSWCIENSGNATAQSKNLRSARAADWFEKWPQAENLSKPVRGAIVILHTSNPKNSSGHVAFVDSWDENGVVLLGGNQIDRTLPSRPQCVCKKKFSWKKVRAYKWLSV